DENGNIINDGEHNYSYDANGNRLTLKEIENSAQEIQTVYSIIENTNRLTKVDDTSYQYDENGNIINDGEHNYSYDARNRLTGVDSTSTYLFNANNMRVKKTTPAGTVLYGWENDRIFAEYNETGNAIQETVYFGSTPIALLKDDNTYRIFADQIDTPRVVTDNSNTVLWAWVSKPFGESQPNEDVDGDSTELSYNLRFPGQYYDGETGKHYNFNRDYNPVTGRYVTSDPIGLGGGINTYSYTRNIPIMKTDFLGLCTGDAANDTTQQLLARTIYSEAQLSIKEAKDAGKLWQGVRTMLGIAFSVRNRVNRSDFPNSYQSVVCKISGGKYEFRGVGKIGWKAFMNNNGIYINQDAQNNALGAAWNALNSKPDITNGAVFFRYRKGNYADLSKKLEQKINSGALTIVYEQAIGSVGTWVFMK
ncbi:MAG TPA: hypothetical protein EYH38_11595, partial [Leucothrix sp.]|nr:hypothetical protein [Leucothrix sp.]